MSKRSKRGHPQQNQNHWAPQLVSAKATAKDSKSGTKRRSKTPLRVAALIVAAAAVLYAVNGGGGRKGETAASSANSAASITPAPALPAPPLLAATAGVASASRVSGPKIQFAMPEYDFGQIKGGAVVKYTYVFTNVGSSMLEISNVQASCGCTTAGEWSRQVESGKTGSIPIQFNSGNFSGHVGKTITVTCNDPKQPSVVLQIKGTIWKPNPA